MTENILEVYTLDSTSGTYTRIGEITTFYNLVWNKASNKVAMCTFNLNTYSQDGKFIQPFKNWILVKRNGVPELFNIVSVRGGLSTDSGQLRIVCYSILYSLKQIYVEGSYVNIGTDAGTIATELIALAQAKSYANFGIQSGTIETVGNTDETLYYQSIGDAIVNQSDNIVGYDFSFVPILDANQELDYIQFNIFNASGVNQVNLPPFELGYSVNVVDFGMAGEVYNKIYTLGSGTGEVEVTESNGAGSQSIFGLRELVSKEASVSIKDTLQSKGDSMLNDTQGVKLELAFKLTEGVKPYYGDFGLGDTLKVNINIGNTFFNFQGTAKVKELEFQFDNADNKETIEAVIEYYKT